MIYAVVIAKTIFDSFCILSIVSMDLCILFSTSQSILLFYLFCYHLQVVTNQGNRMVISNHLTINLSLKAYYLEYNEFLYMIYYICIFILDI